MKKLLFLGFAGMGLLAGAQINTLMPKASLEQTVVASNQGHYDGNTRQMLYYDHVSVTNPSMKMTCDWLAIDIPTSGNPTNVVAETNVVINFTDKNGQTNLLVADKAVYAYHVVNTVTNETITFTGHPRDESADMVETGDPMIWDAVEKQLYVSNPVTQFRKMPDHGNGTNATPFNLFK